MQQHLEELTVQQFRGLRDLKLTDLGRVNLLVGMNNSGKTSVLEAVSIYCQSSNPLEWLRTAQRRDARRDIFREPAFESLKWLFPRSSSTSVEFYEGEIIISGKGSFDVERVQAIYKETLGIGRSSKSSNIEENSLDLEDDEVQIDTSRRGADVEVTTVVRERSNLFDQNPNREIVDTFQIWENEPFTYRRSPSGPVLPVTTITPISHWVDRIQISSFSNAILDRRRQEVIELVRQIDPQVKNLEIISRRGIRSSLYVDHEVIGLAPLTVFGDGLRRVLLIALSLQSAKGGILLVDEIETAIHKSVLGGVFNRIVNLCSVYDVQLFITTHSIEAIDAILSVDSLNLEDITEYRLDSFEGHVSVQKYGGKLLRRLRYERGLDVR